MSHLSEDSKKLSYDFHNINSLSKLKNITITKSSVSLFILSDRSTTTGNVIFSTLIEVINKKISAIKESELYCFLADEVTISDIYIKLHSQLKYQLFISIKLVKPIERNGFLPGEHVSLLILSAYQSTLKHTKTRIGYTYCPVCEKTTKDYGGKKHLYHEYGTIISDVWRDISYDPNEIPNNIIDRLCDLFGLEAYTKLDVYDLNKIKSSVLFVNESQISFLPKYIESDPMIQTESILINDDCINALNKLPDSSVDFCFADPPYNLSKKYDLWEDDLELEEYFSWCNKWINALMRVLKPGKFLALLNIPLWTMRYYSILKEYYQFVDWIVWESLSMPVRMIMPSHYSILVFSKGSPIVYPAFIRTEHSTFEAESLHSLKENFCLRSNCINYRNRNNIIDKVPITNLWWDIHRLKHNTRRVDHPTQLPPKLMFRLISLLSNENDLVLDPFNGSGTTTLSSEILNRKFIGIEKSQNYFNLSLKRHAELRSGIDPFGKRNGTPLSKNTYVPRQKKQKYIVSKKILQLEVKTISQILGHIPTKEEVEKYSKYPMKYFDDYFINWAEVCAAARTTGMVEDKIIVTKKSKEDQLNIF
ncbi:MAG: site-specific DNA-methyltransferase [bacterium]